ncbi:MAG: hypothetical protein KDA74_12360 [Planctomycetaceae bacterium]|nr:hypothetical protein [Planctomycetaceae bacterium]
MIKFECESCFQEYNVRDERAGQTLKCKSCGSKMRVPDGDDDLVDDFYEEDFEAPARPSRKKKSSAGPSKKKKSSGSGSNVVGIIAGVAAFVVAFFISYTVVKGLFPGKENQEQPAEVAAEVQPEGAPAQTAEETVAANAAATPTESTPVDTTPIPDDPKARSEELKRLHKQMAAYSETMKTTTDAEERKVTSEKMKTTFERIKRITGKQREETAAAQKKSGSPSDKTSSTQANQPWSSLVDPPLVVADWSDTPKLSIDLRNIDGNKVIPNSFSPFIGFRDRNREFFNIEIWNLATEKVAGQISIPLDKGWRILTQKIKMSTDGKTLLFGYVVRDTKMAKMESWSVETGQKLADWEVGPADSILSKFEICGSDLAFAKMLSKEASGFKTMLKVWNLSSGTLIKEREVKYNEFSDLNFKISPGGNYLFSYDSSNKFHIYDLRTLDLVREIDVKQLLSKTSSEFGKDPYYIYNGMNFSADGKELGLLLMSSDNTTLWTLDLSNGQAALEYHVTGNLSEATRDPGYSGENMVWFPDGRGWLLYGDWFIDRKLKQVLWTLKPVPYVIIRNEIYLTPKYLLAETASALRDAKGRALLNRKPKLVPVKIPEQKIADSLAAYQSQSEAILGAGQQVSIDVSVGNLKFGDHEEVKTVLAEVMQQRLESDTFKVAPDQPVVLKIEYQEQDGNKLQMTKRGTPGPGNPLGQTPTGETLQATAAAFKLSWVDTASKRTLWSTQALVNPRFLILRNATAEEARTKMFEGLQNRLMAESIPYFIPRDKKLSTLPLEIELPD